MRLANKKDIKELSNLRINQQMDDWKEEYENKLDLFNRTKIYLKKHLNKDLYIFVEEENGNIIATCGIQIIDYLPQCNDNGKQGYVCNVYTKEKYRNQGIQTLLIKRVISFAKENRLCELSLSTDSDEAISIYKKMGFEFDNLMMKLEIK